MRQQLKYVAQPRIGFLAVDLGGLDQAVELYAIHEPHLPKDGLAIYRGISVEQFHGSKAS